MLFDSVFNKAKWPGKDYFPSCPEWKEEVNKWLEFIESKNQLKRYRSRLNSPRPKQRDGALGEIRAAYTMEIKLKYPVIKWEEKTVGNQDVDFVILNGDDDIYCEVKTPIWESELTNWESELTQKEKERLVARKDKPKYINAEAHFVATWRNIRKALQKSRPKFLPDCKNLVILTPDLFLNPSVNSNTDIGIALYLPDSIQGYNNEKGYFTNKNYENIGGILILICELRSFTYKFKYQHEFYENKNAKKPFSIKTKI